MRLAGNWILEHKVFGRRGCGRKAPYLHSLRYRMRLSVVFFSPYLGILHEDEGSSHPLLVQREVWYNLRPKTKQPDRDNVQCGPNSGALLGW